MPGKKCKSAFNAKQVAAYRQKLRRPAGSPLKLTNRERKTFTFKAPFPQRFSLPSNILRYIARNPSSPNGHLKLISTCKSLFRMSRIIPLKKLAHRSGDDGIKWEANGVPFDFKNQFSKLWIHDELYIWSYSMPNIASTLVHQIHKFSLRKLTLFNQVLTFEELEILVSGGNLESSSFDLNIIKNPDGSITEFEKVFKLLGCKNMDFKLHPEHHGIGVNTTRKIIEVLSSDQIPAEQDIAIWNIPRNFDFSLFSEFLKENMTSRQHSFYLNFASSVDIRVFHKFCPLCI